jgi:hypothetical protein
LRRDDRQESKATNPRVSSCHFNHFKTKSTSQSETRFNEETAEHIGNLPDHNLLYRSASAMARIALNRKSAVASPVMNSCLYYARDARLRHGGVEGANSEGQILERPRLLAPMPPGVDIARLAGLRAAR